MPTQFIWENTKPCNFDILLLKLLACLPENLKDIQLCLYFTNPVIYWDLGKSNIFQHLIGLRPPIMVLIQHLF